MAGKLFTRDRLVFFHQFKDLFDDHGRFFRIISITKAFCGRRGLHKKQIRLLLQRQVIAILTGQDLQGCTEFLTEKLDQITAVFVKGFPVKKEIRRYKRQEKARLWLDCRRPAGSSTKIRSGHFHTVREHAKIRIFRRKRANVKQTGNIVGILIKKDAVSGGIPEI